MATNKEIIRAIRKAGKMKMFAPVNSRHDVIYVTVFFIEHLFFKFMEMGRNGIKEGTKDVIDTLCFWYIECGKCTHAELNDVTAAEYDDTCDNLTRTLVDGFVSTGSIGFRTPIHWSFNLVFSILNKGK